MERTCGNVFSYGRLQLRIFLFATAVLGQAFAADAENASSPPKGWRVESDPSEPALSKLSDADLIDRLQAAEVDIARRQTVADPVWSIGGRPSLGAEETFFSSPAAVELARRGRSSLPSVLEHLTDARPTKIVYVVAPANPTKDGPPWFSDDYDPRDRAASASLPGVNTKVHDVIGGDGVYTFKVGDLCYCIVGQIVGRTLVAAGPAPSNQVMMISRWGGPGPRFTLINSPIVHPALAAAARKDWDRLESADHVALLRADCMDSLRAQNPDFTPLRRLLFFYPQAGVDVVEKLLRRTLIEPKPGELPAPSSSDDTTATFYVQENLVNHISGIEWDGKSNALLSLFYEAAKMAEADLAQLPPRTWNPAVMSLGSSLALACGKQLMHQGHDDELNAFFTARAEALRAALVAHGGKNDFSDTLGMVNSIQEEACRAFLTQLTSAEKALSKKEPAVGFSAASYPIKLGTVALSRSTKSPQGLSLDLVLVEPAPDRVLEGRMIITSARDNAGVVLQQEEASMLNAPSVGRTSNEILERFPKTSFSGMLSTPAPKATSLVVVEGRLELIVPDLDPDGTIVIKDITAKIEMPVETETLRKNGIALVVLNKTAYEKLSPSGSADAGWPPAPPSFPGMPPQQPFGLEANDLALRIQDPMTRLARVEFQDKDGGPLRYDRNGWYHGSGTNGWRFDAYRLPNPISPGTQLKIWLMTDKSRVVVPLTFAHLPITEKP